MSLPTRWIICTKWAIKLVGKPGEVAPVPEFLYFWTPVGSAHVYTKKSSIRGVPVSYTTEQEAMAGLTKIVNDDTKLASQNLKFSLVEVRYVPNKIKAYKQDWYNKYGVKEVEVELKAHKFIDTMK